MKQGNKIVSYVVLLLIVFVLIQTASLFGLFHISFKAVEKVVARKNLQFCINSLQAELTHLNGLVFEWAAWDDAGLFIEGQKPQFLGENTSENLLREKKLDVLCLLDIHGKPLWSRAVRNSGNEYRSIQLDLFLPENLQKNPALWNHQDVNSCVFGFCSTENGVLMLSSRPVTNNTNSPPIHGTVIFGRFITDQVIADIARQTCLDFKWWNLHSDYTKQAMEKYVSQITPDNPVYIEFELNSAAAYTILHDINKKDAVLVKFLMTDELASYRDELMIKSAGVFFVEGFIFLVCLSVLINRLCVKYFSESAPLSDLLPAAENSPLERRRQPRNADKNTVLAGEK
jgi:sensor domain CHASE-containing protein